MNLLDSALVCAERVRRHFASRSKKQIRIERDDWKRWCKMAESQWAQTTDELASRESLVAAQHEELVLLRKVAEAAQPFGRMRTLLIIEYDETERLLREAIDNYTTWKEQHHG